ncbi:MAG: PqqD family protein [Ruminococcaceae bacterium]|nr:PqqD family protein [Oscillospiraceae bacterium]
MEIKKEFALRQIEDEYLLIPSGKAALDLNGMITLNEIAAEIWKVLPQMEHEEMLVAWLLQEYEVSEETARRDVREFLCLLRGLEIL